MRFSSEPTTSRSSLSARRSITSDPWRRWFTGGAHVGAHGLVREALGIARQLGPRQAFDGRPDPVDDRLHVAVLGAGGGGDGLQGGGDRAAVGVSHHDDQSGAEALGGELDAADLGGGHDVAGYANDEQILEALVEDDLGRRPAVRAADHDGDRRLRGHVAAAVAHERVDAAHVLGVACVPLAQSGERLECCDHRSGRGHGSRIPREGGADPRLSSRDDAAGALAPAGGAPAGWRKVSKARRASRAIVCSRIASAAGEACTKTAIANRWPSGRVTKPTSLVALVTPLGPARTGLVRDGRARRQLALEPLLSGGDVAEQVLQPRRAGRRQTDLAARDPGEQVHQRAWRRRVVGGAADHLALGEADRDPLDAELAHPCVDDRRAADEGQQLVAGDVVAVGDHRLQQLADRARGRHRHGPLRPGRSVGRVERDAAFEIEPAGVGPQQHFDRRSGSFPNTLWVGNSSSACQSIADFSSLQIERGRRRPTARRTDDGRDGGSVGGRGSGGSRGGHGRHRRLERQQDENRESHRVRMFPSPNITELGAIARNPVAPGNWRRVCQARRQHHRGRSA